MNKFEFITTEDCHTIVKKYKRSDDIVIKNYAIVPHSNGFNQSKCNNFLLKITAEIDNEKNYLQFLAKKNSEHDNNFIFREFKRILPRLEYNFMPKLYFRNKNFLVYNDLLSENFETTKIFDLNHIQMVLKALAELHASGIAFEDQKLKELRPGETYRIEDEYNINFMRPLFPSMHSKEFDDFLNLVGDDLEFKENLEGLIEELKFKQIPSKFRRTICHGNLKFQNILFKYENKNPVECKLVDLSAIYGPPAYDILQLLFFNTNAEFRQHHIHNLCCNYYEYLKNKLQNFSINLEKILSYEDYKISLNYLTPLIKIETVFYQMFFTKQNNEIVKKENKEKLTDKCFLYEALNELKEIVYFPNVTREDCYEIVGKKISTTSYDFISFTTKPLDEIKGFLGHYLKLKINIKQQLNKQTFNLFVKCMPKGKSSQGIVTETGCFFKELFIYQTIVPMMKQFGINIIDDCLSACYLTRSEDLMVFDDISLLNYHALPSWDPYNFETLSVILKQLAKFHGSMIILEEKLSEDLGKSFNFYERYKEYITEVFFLNDESHYGAKVMQTGIRSIKDVVNLYPDLKTTENQELLKKHWDKIETRFFEATKPSKKYKNVLAHGDLWTSNILLHFENGKAVDCRFVDFQITRYCPPAHDVLCVLHIASSRSIRFLHKTQLIEIYYEKLTKILSSFNYNINKILPHDSFIESLEYIKPQIILQSIMYNEFGMCTPEQIKSFLTNDEIVNKVFFEDRKEYLAEMCSKSVPYKERLRQGVEDLYEMCKSMDD